MEMHIATSELEAAAITFVDARNALEKAHVKHVVLNFASV